MLFLQPHLSLFFLFFYGFSAIDDGVALPSQLSVLKQLVLAMAQGLNGAGQTLFLTPLGLLGHKTGIFGCSAEG